MGLLGGGGANDAARKRPADGRRRRAPAAPQRAPPPRLRRARARGAPHVGLLLVPDPRGPARASGRGRGHVCAGTGGPVVPPHVHPRLLPAPRRAARPAPLDRFPLRQVQARLHGAVGRRYVARLVGRLAGESRCPGCQRRDRARARARARPRARGRRRVAASAKSLSWPRSLGGSRRHPALRARARAARGRRRLPPRPLARREGLRGARPAGRRIGRRSRRPGRGSPDRLSRRARRRSRGLVGAPAQPGGDRQAPGRRDLSR